MEDLKERYYHICAKLANVRAAPGTDLKIPVFDAGHERRRKEQLERLYNRTPEQVRACVREGSWATPSQTLSPESVTTSPAQPAAPWASSRTGSPLFLLNKTWVRVPLG